MALMPNSTALSRASSVFSLHILAFCAYSPANSSMMGDIILQGPHQGAQKSTRTGTSLLWTISSKLASVSSIVLPAMIESFPSV